MPSIFESLPNDRPLISRRTKIIAAVIAVLLIVWWTRVMWSRLLPITHEGVVYRINAFDKGWYQTEDTRQQVQFSILFEDGFDCEGYDTSFVNVRVGDRIKIKGYRDVSGWPWKPDFWECDEGQLVKIYIDKSRMPD